MFKRIIAILTMLTLGMMIVPFSASAETTMDFGQMKGFYKTQGRVRLNGSVLEMDTTSSGFELYFQGSGSVVLHASLRPRYTTNMFFTVIVDGVRTRMEKNTGTTQAFTACDLTLASGLANGIHHIEFYKQTEASSAFVDAKSLTFTGTLLDSPPLDKLTMEVVGDSISGGTSALGDASSPNADYPLYQDGTQTYAYFTGEALGANVRVTQTSGYGAVNGWNSDGKNLQDMFPYTSYWRSSSLEYGFDPAADIVVINLGTNDYSARNKNKMTDAQFKAGAKNLMSMAREKNPNAKVIWCTGMMGVCYQDILTAAVSELGGADNGFYYLVLPKGTDGAAGHPNVAQHRAAAETLTAFIKENCLPSNYFDDFATSAKLSGTLAAAKQVAQPSACLRDAIKWAEAELAFNTADQYRLGVRNTALVQAMNGASVGADLMPRQNVAVYPVEANGSYIWPYYAADGTVDLYKAASGYYWPHCETLKDDRTVNVKNTPYLHLQFTCSSEFNVHLVYKKFDNNTYFTVTASELAGLATTNFTQGTYDIRLDFGGKVLADGNADTNGNIALLACFVYTIGDQGALVSLKKCELVSADFPTEITGSLPIKNGVVSGIERGATPGDLISKMDNQQYLSVHDKNGQAVTSGILKTGYTLRLSVSGRICQELHIAVRGDADCDGAVTSSDARYTLQIAAGTSMEEWIRQAANVSGSGTVTSGDGRMILMMSVA